MPSTHPQEAIGQSPAFLDFQERLGRVAPIERPVLLVGERGTGKEMAARRVHYLSRRWEGPLVTLHCAALSPTLIESELFGHEPGAFTGARERRIGRFEAADGGTLFLDEISLIPMETQEKILRVVEYGRFERVGGSKVIEVDVRIVGATNADLSRAAERGRFKPDLLDRLSFEVLFLPPLRERRDDIVLLASHFAARMAHELGRESLPEFATEATDTLMDYAWPGNVRELKNVVERAVYRADGAEISSIDFNPFESPYETPGLAAEQQAASSEQPETQPVPDMHQVPLSDLIKALAGRDGLDLRAALADVEREAVELALSRNEYHQGRAAESLGLSYDQFRGLYRKYHKSDS